MSTTLVNIGIQGDTGSFSEQAAHAFIKRQKLSHYEIQYLIDSERVLTAIDKHTIDIGIFAIENAQGGVVIESIEAMAVHRCHINDMFHIQIHQNLLTLPGITASNITAIHSHQQALRQCRDYLAEHFWSCPLVEEADTAQAAKALKAGKLANTAAVIASTPCATMYDLEIFEANIHDLKNNLTLFLAVSPYRDQ